MKITLLNQQNLVKTMQRTQSVRGRGGAFRGRGGSRARETALLRSNILLDQRNSVRRLQKDLKEIRDSEIPLVGVTAAPLDDSIFKWHANIRGPADTVYAGGVFHLEMVFPEDYPVSPPSITLCTNVPHANVFGRRLCLDMLEPNKTGVWYQGWTSAYTVQSVLIQLQSFLFVVPKKAKKSRRRTETDDEEEVRDIYKVAVDEANAYNCSTCKHRGPIEPYPPFNAKDNDVSSFVLVRDPK